MKLFVWDLHGTLEQGNEEVVIAISNMALERLGYTERFQPRHSRELYGLKWYQYFEYLLPHEPHETHLELQKRSFKLSDENFDLVTSYLQPSPYALEVLEAIDQSPHKQVLISNTIPTSLPQYIKALAIDRHFGSHNAFPVNAHSREVLHTKEDALAAYREGKDFDEIIVIGDSGTDLRLAEHAGATSYLYAHPGFKFRAEGGDFRVNDLRAVLQHL